MEVSYSISQRKKNVGISTWYLRTSTGGKITYKSLKTTVKKEALAALERLNAQKYAPSQQGTGDVQISTIVTEWIRHIEYQFGKTSKTAICYTSRIKHFTNFCRRNNIALYSTLTPIDLEKFAHFASDLAPKTVSEILKTTKQSIDWAIDNYNLPERNKFKTVKNPKVKQTRVEFWTAEEIEKILAKAPTPGFKAFWSLMAFAGLRFEEARTLKAKNVQAGVITVINGKGGKNEELPISDKLHEIIEPFLTRSGELIPEEVPHRSDKALVELKIAVAAAGVEPGAVTHHKLRHSFASELLRRQVNPEAVKELMRHSGIEILFKHYAHVKRSDLTEAVNKL